jgi:Sap, sulfolipid-1-addressing protein
MWTAVLVLALVATLHPVRIAMIVLLLSRPRPLQNLLTYWTGSLIVGVPALLVPLMVVQFTPIFRSFTHDLANPASAASHSIRHSQLVNGVLLLAIAALMTVRLLWRARQQAHLPTSGGNTSTQVPDSNTPAAISPLSGRAQGAPTEDRSARSAIWRLIGRAHNAWKSLWAAWENGSLWFALVLGLIMAPADGIIFVLIVIMGSGAAIGTQVSAAIVFVAGWLAVAEVIFVTYLVAPAKTQAVLGLLHGWMQTHRRQVPAAITAVAGFSMVVKGMGII